MILICSALFQKLRWQQQSSLVTDDNAKLRNQLISLTKEKEKEAECSEILRRVNGNIIVIR